MLLDDRATTGNIKERIEWLLEGSEDGQPRVLFYSGHGAQIPDYNAAEEVDHSDECLVPYDFDWSAERSIMDKWFAGLYAQLPYETQFIAIFDCCHAGGLTRAGGARVRGLTPPDDIRHRALRWDVDQRAWVPRALRPWNEDVCLPRRMVKEEAPTKRRLGYAIGARTLSREVDRAATLRRVFRNKGPYMPFLLEACREDELAYEYREGSSSYGAFTYFLAQTLRSTRKKRSVTFQELVAEAAARVGAHYKQTPQLECPTSRRHAPILEPGGRAANQRRRARVSSARGHGRASPRAKAPARKRRPSRRRH
jgi:hypothetical protein